MISNAVERLLPEMAARTLETMFFTLPDSVSLGCTFVKSGRPSGELICASLTFRSPTSQCSAAGHFGLIASYSVAKKLSADFLGWDEDAGVAQDRVISVIAELANMICGAVLSEMEFDASFDLSSPESVCIGANEPGPDFTGRAPSICRFEFRGGGVLLLFLALEESV